MNFSFGDRVKVTRKLVRVCRVQPKIEEISKMNWRIWKRKECLESNCIFLGYRTLHNGIVEYEPDNGYYFVSKEKFKVVLICPGLHRNTFYAPLYSVSKIEGDKDESIQK